MPTAKIWNGRAPEELAAHTGERRQEPGDPPGSSAGTWKYNRGVHRLPFLLAYTLFPLHLVSLELRGPWSFLALGYVFAVIPLLDWLSGHSELESDLRGPRSTFHDRVLEAWLPLQVAVLVWTLHEVSVQPAGPVELLGLAISLGAISGAGGITIAHELVHRPGRFHRALAELLMTCVGYQHFCIEHVHGHHRRACTPEDPVSARRGESIYAFFVRAIVLGMRSAWRIEAERCRRAGVGALDPRNRRLRYPASFLLLVAAVGLLAGPWGLALFLGQALVAVLLLESADYIEHYGLERRRLPDGRFERMGPQHSWNSTHRMTSAFLFHLTRHSDHHFIASRPYDQLRARPDAPSLPAGYPTMMLLAYLPPLWFRVMDPRAEAALTLEA